MDEKPTQIFTRLYQFKSAYSFTTLDSLYLIDYNSTHINFPRSGLRSSFKDPHKVTVLMVVRGGKGSCLGHTRRVPTNCDLSIKPNHPTPNTRVTHYKVDGS